MVYYIMSVLLAFFIAECRFFGDLETDQRVTIFLALVMMFTIANIIYHWEDCKSKKTADREHVKRWLNRM